MVVVTIQRIIYYAQVGVLVGFIGSVSVIMVCHCFFTWTVGFPIRVKKSYLRAMFVIVQLKVEVQ